MENKAEEPIKEIVKSQTAIGKEKEFLQTLIDSKSLPPNVKTVEAAFTISQYGKELGFQPMQSFHYIISISGRLSLTAMAVNALLRKHGITVKTIKDYHYIYADGTESYFLLADKGGPIDRVTEIEMSRDGYSEIIRYTYSDAKKQGLLEKDNWQRMPREMAYARCTTKGARRLGPDILLGLYTVGELQEAGLITNAEEAAYAEYTLVKDPISDAPDIGSGY